MVSFCPVGSLIELCANASCLVQKVFFQQVFARRDHNVVRLFLETITWQPNTALRFAVRHCARCPSPWSRVPLLLLLALIRGVQRRGMSAVLLDGRL